MDWSLKFQTGAGTPVTKTFAAWVLTPPQLKFVNQGRDGCSFRAAGRLVDAADLFDLGTDGIGHKLTVLRDTTPIFQGIVTSAPRSGEGRREDNAFEVAGPWWFLEETTYEQAWKSWDGAALVDVYSSHLMLGQAPNGTYLTNSAVVADVVAFAAAVALASCGFVFSADLTGFDGIEFPTAEVRDLSCAEAIRKVLRYTPDAKLWWDYSGANPVLRVARRGALTAVDLPLSAGDKLQKLDITPRRDLFRTSVFLDYEITTTTNGIAYTGHQYDKWPLLAPDQAVRAYKSTINLQGASVLKAYIETREILPLTEAWWKAREAWLNDATVTNFTPPPAFTRDSSLTYELVQGQIADWMRLSNGDVVLAEQDVVAGTGNVSQNASVMQKVFSTNIVATNAPTGLYSAVQQYGEPVPVGLAQHIYEAVNTLHWSGSFTIVEDEYTGLVGLANVLNITDGLTAWETMNAFVWAVTVDAGRGSTTVEFGPSENLGPADLVDLSRASRRRMLFTAPSVRVNAQGGASYALGRSVAKMQASSSPPLYSEMVMTDPASAAQVQMRVTDLPGSAVARLQETFGYNTVDGVCVLQRCYVLRTAWEDL